MVQSAYKICIGEAGFSIGTLWFESAGGREYSAFQYDETWLDHPDCFAIAPSLTLDGERKFFRAEGDHGSPLPLPVADTTPDSWGRSILRKDVRMGGAAGLPLTEVDFLVAVDDFSRMGALRIRSLNDGAPFLATAPKGRHPIPPVLELDQLGLDIASIESDAPEASALRRLRQVGSSLGGARPKCSIIDSDKRLAIAKFTSKYDTHPVEKAEVLTLRLAALCDLDVPKARLEMSAGLPVAIIARFDRTDAGRVPFISAQTMLDVPSANGATYLNLADALRKYAADPKAELKELFQRIAYSILVSNVDDHLRNHGFLYAGNNAWRLSPMFDVNPAPERFRELKTAIADPAVPDASIALLVEYAFYFEIGPDDAARLIGTMARRIAVCWEKLAREVGMKGAEIHIYRPAFEHEEAQTARALAASA